MNNWRRYAQLVGPLVGSLAMAGVLAWQAASADKHITGPEWVLGVTQLLMVASVWAAANVPGWEKGKKVQAAIFAVLALLAAFVTGGITGDEAVQLVITGLSALGVMVTAPTPLLSQPARTGRSPRSGLRY